MKKIYTKPEIFFENFSLSTNIATCDVPHTPSYGVCGVGNENGDGLSVFNMGISGSDCQVQGGGPEDDPLCYHIPDPGSRLFSS